MKYKIIGFILMVSSYTSYCQTNLIPLSTQDTLPVSDIKTTHLLFNDDIMYLDIGSHYFVADTLKQMVRLKHTGEQLENPKSLFTNLTVITKNGSYYSIAMGYNFIATPVTYEVKKSNQIVSVFTKDQEEKEQKTKNLAAICNRIKHLNSNISIKNKKHDVAIEISGIFYVEEKIGIRMSLKNKSTIDFDIDHILFRTKLNKRIAADYLYQERLITPIYSCNEFFEIKGLGHLNVTLLFDKFMINQNEKLAVDVFEENGGRSATIIIPRKKLLQPKII